ncbi:hypothetical protein niasHS_009573 [Heterodera schachtii]|uniref:Uncharacterized protein n=1 Tax=Heterodera schachtii TaxID=97005 RepID=A0ABD2JB59_HETSC
MREEFSRGFGDTFSEWGRYTNLCEPEVMLKKTDYNDIEEEFRAMCQCYVHVFHDSRVWTNKLSKRIS